MSRLLPISFTASLALAVLEGRKTETRRPIGHVPPTCANWQERHGNLWATDDGNFRLGYTAPCATGDRLYVREPATPTGAWWSTTVNGAPLMRIVVRYACDRAERAVDLPARLKKPVPGHGLPNGCYREASRMTLPVLSVHPERLQDITEDAIHAEGFIIGEAFIHAWNAIYAKRGHGWDANPWVWVIRWGAVEVTL